MPVKKFQKKKIETKTDNNLNNQIKAVLLLAASIFIFAGIQFTAQTGWAGYVLNQLLRMLCGEAALAVPFLIAFIAIGWSIKVANFPYRLIGLIIIFIVLLISLHLRLVLQELTGVFGSELYRSMLNLGLQQKGGGVLGAL
ncbi:MAG TPA: hypothetical protein DCQ14_03465, partial [Firmicutes bacterium]|nr:hypothetical protein [Bacillota bacterium]